MNFIAITRLVAKARELGYPIKRINIHPDGYDVLMAFSGTSAKDTFLGIPIKADEAVSGFVIELGDRVLGGG